MDRRLVCVDLFSGLGGFSEAFVQRGHKVVRIDNDPRFKDVPHTVIADICELRHPSLILNGNVDVILASPPCQAFSVASIPAHWKNHEPDEVVFEGLKLVTHALRLVAEVNPRYWLMENPRGMLRTVIGKPKEDIYLCAYGTKWKKPTDIWGRYPGKLRRPCAPHESAPRGSKKGVQGITDPAERAKLPYELSEEVCKRIEDAFS